MIMDRQAVRDGTSLPWYAKFLRAKPYYLSNLGNCYVQPYYIIVSAHREKTMYSLRIQYGGLGRIISQRKVF